jgi:hypothetical protein
MFHSCGGGGVAVGVAVAVAVGVAVGVGAGVAVGVAVGVGAGVAVGGTSVAVGPGADRLRNITNTVCCSLAIYTKNVTTIDSWTS